MHLFPLLLSVAATASALTVPEYTTSKAEQTKLADAVYDGTCFYPVPTKSFNLNRYLGHWYQVAGTPFGRTAGARCVQAQYEKNADGTVKVINTGRVGTQPIGTNGTATPAADAFGKGAFTVSFPGFPNGGEACPGPNYIVQETDSEHSIVQTAKWGVLYILSREQFPKQAKVDKWIKSAVKLGSNATAIIPFEQNDC